MEEICQRGNKIVSLLKKSKLLDYCENKMES